MFSATRLFLCYVYNGVFISRLCKNCSIDVCDAEEAWKLVAGLHSAEMPLELFQQLVREHVETLSDVTSVHADPDLTSQLVLQLPKGCLLQILGEPQQATGQQWGLWKVVCFVTLFVKFVCHGYWLLGQVKESVWQHVSVPSGQGYIMVCAGGWLMRCEITLFSNFHSISESRKREKGKSAGSLTAHFYCQASGWLQSSLRCAPLGRWHMRLLEADCVALVPPPEGRAASSIFDPMSPPRRSK